MNNLNDCKIGDRVATNSRINFVSYITDRNSYLKLPVFSEGTVIGFSSTGKVAVEFDNEIFIGHKRQVSSLDSGCHGKGKIHHSVYLPHQCIDLIKVDDFGYEYIDNNWGPEDYLDDPHVLGKNKKLLIC